MRQRVLLDLFCGCWGWSRAFAKRGWKCIGVDLVQPSEIPAGCEFWKGDVRQLGTLGYGRIGPEAQIIGCLWSEGFDAIVASSPCEQFTIHGMANFHPSPAFPEMGLKLFNSTRQLCLASGLPYVMENVRAAQEFVGPARAHAGSFYLWGNAVPPLIPKGLVKGFTRSGGRYRKNEGRSITPQEAAIIPAPLANCVADYFERLLEQRESAA